MRKKVILFICIGNSGRSQIAESFFNYLSKNAKALSAGIKPDKKIHPWTAKLMEESGIDISKQKPKLLNHEMLRGSDKIIILDSELLHKIPKKYLNKTKFWKIGKLSGKSMKEVRKIRNQIEKKVKQLIGA